RAAAFPDEGTVVDRRDERIARRLRQGGEVNRRLEERADRPRRVDRAVVAAITRVASADERLHLAARRIGDHYRAFEAGLAEAALLVVLSDALGKRALGRLLRARIERREDAQAFRAQILVVVVAAQLPVHELDEG